MVRGGGSIHSQVSASDLGRGLCLWGVRWGRLALFQARVTRALSAPWRWGPVAMDTNKSTDKNMLEWVKKWEGGGPGVSTVGSSCDGQEEARLLIYLKKKKKEKKEEYPEIYRPVKLRQAGVWTRMQRLCNTCISYCPSLLN